MKWAEQNQWALVVQNPTTQERCEAYFCKEVRRLERGPTCMFCSEPTRARARGNLQLLEIAPSSVGDQRNDTILMRGAFFPPGLDSRVGTLP